MVVIGTKMKNLFAKNWTHPHVYERKRDKKIEIFENYDHILMICLLWNIFRLNWLNSIPFFLFSMIQWIRSILKFSSVASVCVCVQEKNNIKNYSPNYNIWCENIFCLHFYAFVSLMCIELTADDLAIRKIRLYMTVPFN